MDVCHRKWDFGSMLTGNKETNVEDNHLKPYNPKWFDAVFLIKNYILILYI